MLDFAERPIAVIYFAHAHAHELEEEEIFDCLDSPKRGSTFFC